MFRKYDVISSGWSSHFGVKIHVFQLLSAIKVNLLPKMMQRAYLCDVFHVKHKILPLSVVFKPDFSLQNKVEHVPKRVDRRPKRVRLELLSKMAAIVDT